MKISLLHYSAPPVVGGVESVMGHHARLLTDAGHTVQLIAGRGEQTNPDVPFISLPLVDSRHPHINALKPALDAGEIPSGFADAVAQIHAEISRAAADSDWLIAHNVCSLNKNLALTAALFRLAESQSRPRLMLWHHDLAWTTPRYRSQLHDGYPWDLLRSDWPGVIQVTVSATRQMELAALMDVPLERIHVVPNGVDAAHFLKLENKTRELYRKLNLGTAFPLLLLPVRITPRKNIELALHILAEMRKDYTQAALVITGPLGPHNPANRRYFEKLTGMRTALGLQSSAFFLAEMSDEFLPDAVISDFYALADALIFPSREEGFGIPMLEAGLAGIPVFAADIPQLREIGDGLATFFSPDGDPAVIAKQIHDTFEQNNTMGLRNHVRQHYTWEQIYRQRIDPIINMKEIQTHEQEKLSRP